MKKQILFIAAISSAILFSCTKEKIDTPQARNSDEIVAIANSQKGGGGGGVNLNKGLQAEFEFNNTLHDTTNQVGDGISTVNRVLYTRDRKGVANRAIYFNEGYGVNIFDIPLGTDMSISVWLNTESFPVDYMIPIVEGDHSFSFMQLEATYQGAYWNGINGQYVVSSSLSAGWHHLAATRDGTSLKYYVDGFLIGSSPSPAGAGPYPSTNDYDLGYGFNNGYKYWKGSMDDLRIYKRVLSASEITALYNL